MDTDTLGDALNVKGMVDEAEIQIVDELTDLLLSSIEQSMDFIQDERFSSFDIYLPKNKKNKIRR